MRIDTEYLTTDEFLKAVENVGVENILVLLECHPLRSMMGLFNYESSSDAVVVQSCVISQTSYKLADRYKIKLVPINSGYSPRTLYLEDFMQMLRKGQALLYGCVYAPQSVPEFTSVVEPGLFARAFGKREKVKT